MRDRRRLALLLGGWLTLAPSPGLAQDADGGAPPARDHDEAAARLEHGWFEVRSARAAGDEAAETQAAEVMRADCEHLLHVPHDGEDPGPLGLDTPELTRVLAFCAMAAHALMDPVRSPWDKRASQGRLAEHRLWRLRTWSGEEDRTLAEALDEERRVSKRFHVGKVRMTWDRDTLSPRLRPAVPGSLSGRSARLVERAQREIDRASELTETPVAANFDLAWGDYVVEGESPDGALTFAVPDRDGGPVTLPLRVVPETGEVKRSNGALAGPEPAQVPEPRPRDIIRREVSPTPLLTASHEATLWAGLVSLGLGTLFAVGDVACGSEVDDATTRDDQKRWAKCGRVARTGEWITFPLAGVLLGTSLTLWVFEQRASFEERSKWQ